MRKEYWKHFAAAIAALSALATLATALFDLGWIKECLISGTLGTILVILASCFYAKWQVRIKKKVALTLYSEMKLTIKEGDLFEQKGVICIPFNEYFDTHVGDGVVEKSSLHGLFINKYYGDRVKELDSRIRKLLPDEFLDECKRRVDGCPKKRYELGTCVDIREGENTYVLFALSHFDKDDKANISRSEYAQVIEKLMEHLSKIVGNKPVYMPLIGAGLARINRTPQRILVHLVDILDFEDRYSIPGGVNILIKSLNSVKVNLNTIEDVVKKGVLQMDKAIE